MNKIPTPDLTRNLTPGGYAELQDVDVFIRSDDNTLTEDHALRKWGLLLDKAAKEHGTPFMDTNRFKPLMAEVGFVDIKEKPFKWPINRWPKDKRFKELGEWSKLNTEGLLEGLSMALFTRCLGWTAEEVSVFLVDVRKDLNDPKIHAYWSMYSPPPHFCFQYANTLLAAQFMQGSLKLRNCAWVESPGMCAAAACECSRVIHTAVLGPHCPIRKRAE